MAQGMLDPAINTTGWGFLEIRTVGQDAASQRAIPDPVQAYAAGLLEGCLTSTLISHHLANMQFQLFGSAGAPMPAPLQHFLQENVHLMQQQSQNKVRVDCGLWFGGF